MACRAICPTVSGSDALGTTRRRRHTLGQSERRTAAAAASKFRGNAMTARQLDPANRAPLLHWMIFTGLSLFCVVLLWRFGLIRQMVLADRTYISSFIVLFYLATTLHCLWRFFGVSREGQAARPAPRLFGRGGRAPPAPRPAPETPGAATPPPPP